ALAHLLVGDPLHVGEGVDLLAQLDAHALERLRIPLPQGPLPVAPALLALVVKSAVEGPVLEPAAVFLAKSREGLGSLPAQPHLAALEVAEGARERRALHRTVLGEIDTVRAPRCLEVPALVVGQLAAQVLDGIEVDVDGLESAGAGGGVRAVLAGRHLVERQELPECRPGGEQEAGDLPHVAVGGEVAAMTANRGEGKQDAGAPAEIETVCHGDISCTPCGGSAPVVEASLLPALRL